MKHIRKGLAIASQAVAARHPHERMQVEKRQTRFTYTNGPMYFLGQQVVKAMQDSGYPAFIWCLYRPPEVQEQEFADGDSKARAYQSPHQWCEAVDILHPKLYWQASPDYWDNLAACVSVVSERFGVDLTHGHNWGWDSAHIELTDWRKFAAYCGRRKPTQNDLNERFRHVLPRDWRQYQKSVAYMSRMRADTPHEAFQFPYRPPSPDA